ncbi:PREDICTED: huntingtin [Nicrophorus vespilloides]|uniref:Huntingtin n=1 Tax=Nicrophorus vespilloides TaxID=110193 RepID=A0ABM1N3X5_NICVS|nr:PREDICTED: huntingtin [Nicrophorus vespilloides]
MATQEKLLKSLEALRLLLNSNQALDPVKKKEKIQHCNIIVEAMMNPTIKIAKNFNTFLSFAMDVLLQLCDDPESDVRMTADECLNKIIRAMGNSSITKIQIELHKEIKSNGSARSLRAALWRFALLAHHIRPHKGKPYVINLVPCIVKILERTEELVHETLANSMGNIMKTLGCFTMDRDIKCILDACLKNVKNSQSAVIRRTSSSCILSVCLNCRKPYIYLSYVLNNLVDYLIPVQESHATFMIIGVFGCLKAILPKLKSFEKESRMNNYNFSSRKDAIDKSVTVDRFLQIYELSLHYSSHGDHNIVNASLETLNTLFQNCTKQFKAALVNQDGLKCSKIVAESAKIKMRSPSQLSVATTLVSEDNLPLDVELFDNFKSEDIEKWIDESKLSVINVNYVKDDKAGNFCDSIDGTINSANDKSKCFDYSNITIGTLNDLYADSLKSESIVEHMDKLVLSEGSSEKSSSLKADDKSTSLLEDVPLDIDVGDFLDKAVPLIYCGRLLTKQFLLNGVPGKLIPDKKVRVSTKNLALTCLSSIVQIYPQIVVVHLDRKVTTQRISDVLIFANHGDPQLRGQVRILISNFIRAVLVLSNGDYQCWIDDICSLDCFKLSNLMEMLLKGLKDESSTCSRQSLVCLNNFLRLLLDSELCVEAWPILNYLPILAQDPYWLVKVKLVEVISELEYVTIAHAFPTSQYQNKVVFNILFELIKDEDQRVRLAASNAIVSVIPKLYFKHHYPNDSTVTFKAVSYRNTYIPRLFSGEIDGNINKKHFVESMPFPYNTASKKLNIIEISLGKIITKLFQYLLTTTSKYYIYGCIETLNALSFKFPTSVYKKAWSCFKTISVTKQRQIFQRSNSIGGIASPIEEYFISSSADLLNVTVHLLTNGIVCYDLNCHLNLITLAGNLFAGKWLENMKAPADLGLEGAREQWDLFADKTLAQMSEVFLVHVIKMLNIFSHIIDESVPNLPQNKLPNLPSTSNLSPIKRKKSDLGEKKILSPSKTPDKEDKKVDSKVNAMGYFANSPHYMKFYDILKVAYNNYKITLESEASENFLSLLKSTLNTFSQILEVATLTEIGRIAEEILLYLKSIFHLDSASTVLCVQQLLKSLFGTNLSSDSDVILTYLNQNSQSGEKEGNFGFYYRAAQIPFESIGNCVSALNTVGKVDCDGDSTVMGYLHRKENKIGANKGSDRILANYIRIFEPMVIESLKHYTITSNVQLQCQVLQLLGQLVQLRVNYCLLDSEQIFIGFVLKQFEFIEEGQISLSEELIPKIFQFLVHLSYGKQHSKSIIDIPKIIQLCDGLMASGQSPLTHCIPALKPIVEDVFLLRNKSNTPNFKDLETAREFLVSMLLRLLEYGEIIDLFVLVLNESKYCDNSERWIRLSRQVFDVFLSMLEQNKIKVDEGNCFEEIIKLIFALHPSAYKDVDKILINLFGEPPVQEDKHLVRYLGKVSILLLILSRMKEDKLLLRIADNQMEFAPESVYVHIVEPDPLNVTKICDVLSHVQPEVVLLRFLFRIVHISLNKCVEIAQNQEHDFVVKQFSFFLMYCLYIFQSGNYTKITKVAIGIFNDKFDPLQGSSEKIPLEEINKGFLKLRFFYPLLTFQWCHILALVNYDDKKFWSSTLRFAEIKDARLLKKPSSVNDDIVRIGSTIVYADFMSEHLQEDKLSWFFRNNIILLVNLCSEPPIAELINSMHRNSTSSGLLIHSISTKCLDIEEPQFKMNLLQCVEGAHKAQTGNLLMMLIPRLLECRQLAVSRNVSNLLCRRVELLLTMNKNEIVGQLSKTNLNGLMDVLVSLNLTKKHEMLVGLLNKLATLYYDSPPLCLDERRAINLNCIKKLNIHKDWYISIIQGRCETANKGVETAELLSKLSYEDVSNILRSKGFPKSVLKDCFNFGGEELLKVCSDYLFAEIKRIREAMPTPHQVFLVEGRTSSANETKYKSNLCELLADETFLSSLKDIVLAVDVFVRCKDSGIPESSHEDFAIFSVVCLELAAFSYENETGIDVGFLNACIRCCDGILKNNIMCAILGQDTHLSRLCSAVNCLYKLIHELLVNSEPLPTVFSESLEETLDDPETRAAGECVHRMSVLVTWLQKVRNLEVDIPRYLFISLRSIVISLGRLPLVNSFVLTPPTAWKCGLSVKMTGLYRTQVPPLPIDYLQEIEILEEFIFRITLLGWSSRQQFEETWMCLLSVLSANPNSDSSIEEINAITHSTSLVVQAITSLLLQTLYYPRPGNSNVSKFIHVSRDRELLDHSTSVLKLKELQARFQAKMIEKMNGDIYIPDVFSKPNLEKQTFGYSYGQVSVEYLQLSIKIIELKEDSEAAKVYLQREKVLSEIGLDLNSCLQFLLDLYSQWIKSEEVLPLRLLQEVVKSILAISDLFSERSEFVWMLDIFSELSRNHAVEDEIIHQYLVVGICKAVSVLSPDMEYFELAKKIITQSLKSAFISARISSIHGLLYILQMGTSPKTTTGAISEEMQIFLPIAIEYIQCHINTNNNILNQSQNHTLLVWSLAFYLIENIDFPLLDAEFVNNVLSNVLALLYDAKTVKNIYIPLLKGLERLIISKRLPKKNTGMIMQLALDKLKNANPVVALPAAQLLFTSMYIEYSDHLENSDVSNGLVQSNPDHLVQTIEKISVVFDRIKKGFPFEVEILSESLSTLLNDFFSPADILTKVISEFLSPQQRHPMQMSKVVFKIFEYAIEQSQLSLLQDWVVFSLTNFTQSFSIGMATWCLTCFFISASTNVWLRNIFPYVQKRIGRYEYEDRKILCIAGSDFYNNLSNDGQRKTFVDSLMKVKDQVDMPFNELLGCL